MDSFTKFAQSSRNVTGGARKSHSFVQDTTTFLFATALGLGVLFLVLQPGFLVNIPLNSTQDCANLAPLPKTCTTNGGSCSSGAYVPGADTECSDTDVAGKANVHNICVQQQQCNKFWLSKYTSLTPILVHTVIFLVLLVLAGYALIQGGYLKM